MRRRRRHSLLYAIYLRSPLWRLRRRIWIVQARGRCERCGSRRRLTVHHRTYKRLGRERRADVSVLCWDCHRSHHADRRRHVSSPGVLTRIGAAAGAQRGIARHLGHGRGRPLALLALITLPTVLLAAALVLQR
jgi:phage terminase large subunit GpA-like protein